MGLPDKIQDAQLNTISDKHLIFLTWVCPLPYVGHIYTKKYSLCEIQIWLSISYLWLWQPYEYLLPVTLLWHILALRMPTGKREASQVPPEAAFWKETALKRKCPTVRRIWQLVGSSVMSVQGIHIHFDLEDWYDIKKKRSFSSSALCQAVLWNAEMAFSCSSEAWCWNGKPKQE